MCSALESLGGHFLLLNGELPLAFRSATQVAATPVAAGNGTCSTTSVFLFFSNRLGCVGSVLISLVLTVLLVLVLRGCQLAG
jgi:hypothetical protein